MKDKIKNKIYEACPELKVVDVLIQVGDEPLEKCVSGHPIHLEHLLRAIEKFNSTTFIDFCDNLWRTNLKESRQTGCYTDDIKFMKKEYADVLEEFEKKMCLGKTEEERYNELIYFYKAKNFLLSALKKQKAEIIEELNDFLVVNIGLEKTDELLPIFIKELKK
jgi:hypothetical protein